MAKKPSAWWTLLLAVRSLPKDKITAEGLAEAAGIEETENSSPEKIASGWLSKFHRWGYVSPNGKELGGGRWVRVFKITKYGMTREKPKSWRIR